MIAIASVTPCDSYEWYKPEAREICSALPVFAARYEKRLKTGSKLYARQENENYEGGQRDYYGPFQPANATPYLNK